MARGRPLAKESGQEPDEQRLVEAARKDPARFADLYEINFERVYAFIVRRVYLGNRVIEVIPIPGHDPVSLAFYDARTGILLTGDTLYPGRLYIEDFPAYRASVQRLVRYTAHKPVAHILGNHIEQTSTPYLDYPVGTKYQPQEHELPLARAHLLELDLALEEMQSHPVRIALRDFTVWPKP